MKVTGQRGELRVGYQVAARLGSWEIVPGPHAAFQLTATIHDEHEVWSGQPGPKDLVLSLGSAEWSWSGVSPERRGEHVVVVLTERPAVTVRAQTRNEAQGRTQ